MSKYKSFFIKQICLWLLFLLSVPILAQNQVYRCGTEYTNDAIKAKNHGCKLVDTSNISIIYGTKVYNSKTKNTVATTSSTAKNRYVSVSNDQQKKRDTNAKLILQTELNNNNNKLKQQLADFNNGQPERWGIEKDDTKYQNRITSMQQDILRTKEDISSLEKELARLN